MLAMIVQTILKSLSGMTCLAVILADASALSGLIMAYNVVKATELKDPIMTVICGQLMLSATFVDIFNQGIGLIFALCLEMKWMLRIYMGLLLAVLFIRFSIVCKPPVTGLKSAPFLGREWTASNTPYNQMDQDLIEFYSRAPSQSRYSSLATFEVKLKCCGVNGPVDYSAKVAKPESCLPGATLPPPSGAGAAAAGGDNSTTNPAPAGGAAASNSTPAARLEPGTNSTTAPPPTDGGGGGGASANGTTGQNGTSTGSGAGPAAAGGQTVDRPGCRSRVWSLWEGSKITFDATISAMTFSIMTALLTVTWCELWGEGLISGIECCQDEPDKPKKKKKKKKEEGSTE